RRGLAPLRPVTGVSMPARFAACALLGVLLGSCLTVPAGAAEKWGPFRGRILDVETGEPLAGVAVLVVWWENVPNPVQGQRKFFDSRETATDTDGRFEVPRFSPPFFGFRILPPEVMLFAPGYVEKREVVTPPRPKGQPFVDPTEISMRRLKTREELREKDRSRPTMVPDDKMPGFIKAINVERKMLGLGLVAPTPGRQP
ncbi:MAG: hypothetical protein ACREA0_19700, partial [bacterium]